MTTKSTCDRLLVGAMDFGTTYSGYALSFRTKPLKIITNTSWVAGSRSLLSLKAPTCVLVTPEKEFDSFGYQAENKYVSLAEDGEHFDWYLFRHFKMVLHNSEELTQDTIIEDIKGRSLPAISIFTMAVSYLKNHLLQALHDRIPDTKQSDVHFVITVPAIWDDKAKQFMRQAAINAGIENEQLSIALEPEAASLWCQLIGSSRSHPEEGEEESDIGIGDAIASVGTQYMVIDLGGGTADITVHEKQADGTLKEVYHPTGGPWGGTAVDRNFMAFLSDIVGNGTMRQFTEEQMSDLLDLLREFENKKRSVTPKGNKSASSDKVTIKVPVSLKELFERNGSSIEKAVQLSKHGGRVTWLGDKLRVDADIIRHFFYEPINEAVKHVRHLLAEPELNNVNTILLIGGFAECSLVQEAFKKSFYKKQIIIPGESGLVVLKGAVLYGHRPRTITSRIARCSYGVKVHVKFDKSVHPHNKKAISADGTTVCRDVYNKYIEIGQRVTIGHTVSTISEPTSGSDTGLHFSLYTSRSKSTQFVTDKGCRLLGTLQVPLAVGNTVADKRVETSLIFGDTELILEAKQVKTGKMFRAYFSFE
ncbi:hypothetical protein CHS0354_026741 [Potamilus streckersoni]|uniref:Heat shock 70 kDa protein 12A n=1 Tax=Potamilus streckersoni TaxID=2493646 RepID=A0AAE0RN24_9BIVA|nr:hypothetical protein CHS0354_026741 [Potamilus streckersoni]